MTEVYARHQPGGPFQIADDGSDWASHLDRINPIDGMTAAAAPGGGAVFYEQQAATFNGTGIPVTAQEMPAGPDVPAEAQEPDEPADDPVDDAI